MNIVVKIIGILVIVVVFGAALGLWFLVSGGRDISLKDLRAKYEVDQSEYVDLDGVLIHFIDEGDGYPIILTHASYHSARAWDGVAEILKNNFRVIRFDFPNSGLSGLDSKNRYNVDHYQEIISQLSSHLNIEKFHLIGTSSGGTVAFRYASNNPEKVNRFVLVNSAGMPRTKVTNPNRPRGNQFARWLQSYHQSRGYWERALSRTVTSGPPSEAHIEMNYDMNRRAGKREPARTFMRNYVTGDPEGVLNKVKSPTLVLWGLSNPTVMHLEANVIQHWLINAPSLVKKYESLGHYPYIEKPELVASDINSFLLGKYDDLLRQTTMAKVNMNN